MRGPAVDVTALMEAADAKDDAIETPAGIPVKLEALNSDWRVRRVTTKRGQFLPQVRAALEAQGHEIYPMPCKGCHGQSRVVRRACRMCRDGLIEQAQ